MAHGYRAVQWTPFKKRYDLTLVFAILVYLASLDEASRMRVRREQDGRIPA